MSFVLRQIEFTRYYQDIGLEEQKAVMGEMSLKLCTTQPSDISVEIRLSGSRFFADTLIEKVFFNLTENSLHHGVHVTTSRFDLETGPGSPSPTATTVSVSARNTGKDSSRKDWQTYRLGLFYPARSIPLPELRSWGERGAGKDNFEIVVPKVVSVYCPMMSFIVRVARSIRLITPLYPENGFKPPLCVPS